MIARTRPEPLPLYERAEINAQAMRLRRNLHLSYRAISEVMWEYHGVHMSEQGWRARLRRAGARPARTTGFGR